MEHDVYEAGSQRRDCLIKRPDVTIFGVPGLPPHSIDVVTATAARAQKHRFNLVMAQVTSRRHECVLLFVCQPYLRPNGTNDDLCVVSVSFSSLVTPYT